MAISAIPGPALPAILPAASPADQRQAALAALQQATLDGDTDAAQQAFTTLTSLPRGEAAPDGDPHVSITV